MAAPPDRYADRLAGAGFRNVEIPIKFKVKPNENQPYADVYSFFSSNEVEEVNRARVYSLVGFHSNAEAEHVYEVAKSRESPHILTPYLLHGKGIVMERIMFDFPTWLAKTHESFLSNRSVEDVNNNWTTYISNLLLQILPNIIQGLLCLFKSGKYHGNLSHGIALKTGLDKKWLGYLFKMIIPQNAAKLSHSQLCTRDIDHLMSLIDSALDLGYTFDQKTTKESHQEVLSGSPLFKFRERVLQLLKACTAPPSWILDDPIFWTIEVKGKFMNELFERFYSVKSFDPSLLTSVFVEDWFRLCALHDSHGLLQAIYDYGIKQEPKSYSRKTDIVRFWRNAREHFNKKLEKDNAKLLTKPEIEVELDALFPFTGYCHERLEKYFCATSNSKNPSPALVQFRLKLGW